MCGGAEWVAVNIINIINSAGHRTIVLGNERIDQEKMGRIFGKRVYVDNEVVLPLEIFGGGDFHNVYTDGLRTLFLKARCDLVIDTWSNALLPGVNITYVHYPLSARLEDFRSRIPASYFLPYLVYEKSEAKNAARLVLANSKYTSSATRKIVGVDPILLYPPVSEIFYIGSNDLETRENLVVSVSRMSPEKDLALIPHIAKLTDKKIRFVIVGITQSAMMKRSMQVSSQILELIRKNEVSDRVEVMTNVPREKLKNILRRSKVFLHLMHGEHFGVSVVEAMASGCIPIVHNSGGPKEVVPSNLRFDQVEDIATKIEKAVFEWTPKDSELMTNMARSFGESNFQTRFLDIFGTYIRNQWHA